MNRESEGILHRDILPYSIRNSVRMRASRRSGPERIPATISDATPNRLPEGLGVLKHTIDREDGVASGKLERPRTAARLMALLSVSVPDHPRVSTAWPFTPSGLVAHIIYPWKEEQKKRRERATKTNGAEGNDRARTRGKKKRERKTDREWLS